MTTTTTTNNTNTNASLNSRSMNIGLSILARLDLRLLTLICAVSCAAGAVGLHC